MSQQNSPSPRRISASLASPTGGRSSSHGLSGVMNNNNSLIIDNNEGQGLNKPRGLTAPAGLVAAVPDAVLRMNTTAATLRG